MSPRIVLIEGDPDQAILVERLFRRLGRDSQLAALLRDLPSAAAWIHQPRSARRLGAIRDVNGRASRGANVRGLGGPSVVAHSTRE